MAQNQDNNREDNKDRVVHSNTASPGMSSDLPEGQANASSGKTAAKGQSLNEEKSNSTLADEGQGSAGIQGQYAGTDHQKPGQEQEDLTAPRRNDPDKMNQQGSSHLALGGRDGNKSEKIP